MGVGQLDTKRIAMTALSVLDSRGLSGFSIRAVAQALRVSPMALYYYVKNKAHLAALVVSTAAEKMPVAAMSGNWKTDLQTIAEWLRANAQTHPALAELQRTYRIWTPPMSRMAARWFEIWQESGLDDEHALIAAATSSFVISGLIAQEGITGMSEPPPVNTIGTREPNARRLLTAKLSPDRTFELGVLATIEGLHSRLIRGHRKRHMKRREKRPSVA
jgi:AcrR family transcriptional regulator